MTPTPSMNKNRKYYYSLTLNRLISFNNSEFLAYEIAKVTCRHPV